MIFEKKKKILSIHSELWKSKLTPDFLQGMSVCLHVDEDRD